VESLVWPSVEQESQQQASHVVHQMEEAMWVVVPVFVEVQLIVVEIRVIVDFPLLVVGAPMLEAMRVVVPVFVEIHVIVDFPQLFVGAPMLDLELAVHELVPLLSSELMLFLLAQSGLAVHVLSPEGLIVGYKLQHQVWWIQPLLVQLDK